MNLKNLFLSAIAMAFIAIQPAPAAETITGAGSTFVYPILSKWAYIYNKKTGVRLNYQSIGSGGGIKQIKSKTVDFAASDAPLKPEELDRWGLVQWPIVIGGVVPVVNLPGIQANQLRLTPSVLADIYLGKISMWDDARIQAINQGLSLPHKAITVVHRADGSGTTWIFTNYLAKVSPEWQKKVGFGKAVAWPAGVGGKGNEGVAAFVRKVGGAIGYVEYAYALQNRMTTVLLQNRAGRFVAPTAENFQAAAANADWAHAEGYYLVLTDQPGEEAWPITGATFILMYRQQERPQHARAILDFFHWCYHESAQVALDLHYIPMPDKVVRMIEKTWRESILAPDGTPIWK